VGDVGEVEGWVVVGGGGRVEVVVDGVGEVGDVGEAVVVAIHLTVNTEVLYPVVSTTVGLMVQV